MESSHSSRPAAKPSAIDTCIVGGSVIFVAALAISAAFDPSLRLLHVLQALIYVAVVLLTRRRSAWGFGAGVVIASFWNYLVLIASPIGRQGVDVVVGLLRGEPVARPDTLLQCVAGGGHVLIIGACLTGFLRTHPRGRQWAAFVGGGVLALAYLIGIVALVAPPEIAAHLRALLGH